MSAKKAAYMVDGHHVFLAIFDQLQIFFNILADPDFRTLNPTIVPMLDAFEKFSLKPTGEVLREKFRSIDYVSYATRGLLLPGFMYFPTQAVDAHDMYWFDAELPPIEEAKRILKKRMSDNSVIDHNAAQWYKSLEEDKWRFKDTVDRIVPYGLKNSFIQQLNYSHHFPGDVETHLGKRTFTVSKKLFIHSAEKGVDTRLAIQACDIANDASVVEVILVTADTDHIPVVERLKVGGRSVRVFSAAGVSWDFVEAIGRDYASIDDVVDAKQKLKNLNGEIGKRFAEKIRYCPIFWSLLPQISDELRSIAKTGDTIALNHRRQSARRLNEQFAGKASTLPGYVPEY